MFSINFITIIDPDFLALTQFCCTIQFAKLVPEEQKEKMQGESMDRPLTLSKLRIQRSKRLVEFRDIGRLLSQPRGSRMPGHTFVRVILTKAPLK